MSESLSKQCQHLRLISLLSEGKGRKDAGKGSVELTRPDRQKDRRRGLPLADPLSWQQQQCNRETGGFPFVKRSNEKVLTLHSTEEGT